MSRSGVSVQIVNGHNKNSLIPEVRYALDRPERDSPSEKESKFNDLRYLLDHFRSSANNGPEFAISQFEAIADSVGCGARN